MSFAEDILREYDKFEEQKEIDSFIQLIQTNDVYSPNVRSKCKVCDTESIVPMPSDPLGALYAECGKCRSKKLIGFINLVLN
jgi:hypothetical protein